MPPRPFLLFPDATRVEPARRGGGGTRVITPTPAEQKRRLDRKFQNIAASVTVVQPTAQGMEPEQVIVLETVGDNISKLSEAAKRIEGLEWLAELDLEDYTSDGTFHAENKPGEPLTHRLYALMTNQQAMTELLSLWNAWLADPSKGARRGFGPLKDLFVHLHDVRHWAAKDRIDQTQLFEDWRFNLEQRPDRPARFEAELWFRRDARIREAAYNQIVALVRALGGQAISQAAVPAILYHGVLLEMPSRAVSSTLRRVEAGEFTELLNCEGVMFFRPVGQARFPAALGDAIRPATQAPVEGPAAAGNPRVALFDGFPANRHTYINDRVAVDDPDGLGGRYAPAQQSHGTAMASLLIRGDLHGDGTPLKSPVYARPILVPEEDFHGNSNEVTPPDSLLVDLIHQVIRRIAVELESTRDSVHVVNLSIGDAYKPFIRELSPLARLLGWLAWEHKLLILVSAGNQTQPIRLSCSGDEFGRLPDEDALRTVLRAIDGDQAFRRHLSPAEAVNVVTVGAMHADSSTLAPTDRRLDLLRGQRLPSPVATVSPGFRRSVKPEILFPGGKVLFQPPLVAHEGHWEFKPSINLQPPGQLVAAPGTRAMELDRVVYCRGTSNAAALASRTAVQILERLDEVLAEYPGVVLNRPERVCLVKSLLVHGASWGDASAVIERLLAEPTADWRVRQRISAKFLGFGEVDPNRCLFCHDQRATLLGWGQLRDGLADSFRFPLPPSLSAKRIERRLTITLAWLTPINPQHRSYRKAALWLSINGEVLGVTRGNLDQASARRGTVIHQVLSGEKARALPEELELKVNCAEDAGGLAEDIPYGLSVTLEVAEGQAIPIYEDVQARIRPVVPIAARPG